MEVDVKEVESVMSSIGSISKWSRDRVIIYVPAKTQKKLKKHIGKKLFLIIFVLKKGDEDASG